MYRRVRKAKENFHISERKANLVNKAKNVKSNFKAQSGEISRVRIIEFFCREDE